MSQSVSSKYARNAKVWATNGVAQQRCDEESEQQHDVEEVCELLPVVIWALTLTYIKDQHWCDVIGSAYLKVYKVISVT